MSDNPVFNILQIKGKTYAVSEMPVITEIDPITLEVLGTFSYNNDFKGKFYKIKLISGHGPSTFVTYLV